MKCNLSSAGLVKFSHFVTFLRTNRKPLQAYSPYFCSHITQQRTREQSSCAYAVIFRATLYSSIVKSIYLKWVSRLWN